VFETVEPVAICVRFSEYSIAVFSDIFRLLSLRLLVGTAGTAGYVIRHVMAIFSIKFINFAIADRNADHARRERPVRADLTIWG